MTAGRGGGAALLVLLAVAGGVLAPGPTSGAASCGVALAQDDAGSGRDAGAAASTAVAFTRDDRFLGVLGTPVADGLDAEDWYAGAVPAGTDRLMLDVWAPGETYTENPFVVFDLWAPEGGAPVSAGVQHATVQDPAPGTWLVRVHAPLVPGCAAATAGSALRTSTGAEPQVGSYALYYGCHPHCIAAVPA